jgi:Tfp pilus assembly protein PilF
MQNDLLLGLQYHQRGEFDQAGPIYQDVLARDPDNADALHLLGVLEHQRGEQRRGG